MNSKPEYPGFLTGSLRMANPLASWTPHRSPSQEDCNRESHFVTTKQHLSKIEDPGSYALGLLTRWTKAVTQISSWLVQMIRKEFQGPGLVDVMVYRGQKRACV